MEYSEYLKQWEMSTESRDLSFDEWLCLMLDRQERNISKANKIIEDFCDSIRDRVSAEDRLKFKRDFRGAVNIARDLC